MHGRSPTLFTVSVIPESTGHFKSVKISERGFFFSPTFPKSGPIPRQRKNDTVVYKPLCFRSLNRFVLDGAKSILFSEGHNTCHARNFRVKCFTTGTGQSRDYLPGIPNRADRSLLRPHTSDNIFDICRCNTKSIFGSAK